MSGHLKRGHPESLGAAIERVAAAPGLLANLSAYNATGGTGFQWDAGITELDRLCDSAAIK
jgi:hypothetical protein